ncbi:hypothetical protein AB0B28_21695 [Glycomyces sp. NPDC046736]|uniref:hypothetical protein n=1 Tax=Glycomyces sp. NPDC046736 TaxID=3155615 RepID=UPI0033C4762F
MSGSAPESEHSIDLGGVEHTDIPEAEPVEEEPRPRRISNTILACVAIAAVLAAVTITLVKVIPFQQTSAEETVTAFLEAVHAGDVEGALAYTDQPDLTGDFLVPEALDSRWSIASVDQVEFFDEPNRTVAVVYVEIEAYEGTRIGNRLRVNLDGEPKVMNGISTSVAYSQVGLVDLNGVEAPVEVDSYRLILLPGLYEVYPGLPSTITLMNGTSAVLNLGNLFIRLGMDYRESQIPLGWPEVTPEGEAAIAAAVESRLDECIEDPLLNGCPFVFPKDPDRKVALAPGANWEVTEYPQMAALDWSFEVALGFKLTTLVPGAAEAAVIVTEDGRERETVVSCPIWVDNLYAQFDFDGGLDIDAEGDEHCRALTEVA